MSSHLLPFDSAQHLDQEAPVGPMPGSRLAYGTVSDKKFASKKKKEANALKHFQLYLIKMRGIQTPSKKTSCLGKLIMTSWEVF
jgi:hypothetical protein